MSKMTLIANHINALCALAIEVGNGTKKFDSAYHDALREIETHVEKVSEVPAFEVGQPVVYRLKAMPGAGEVASIERDHNGYIAGFHVVVEQRDRSFAYFPDERNPEAGAVCRIFAANELEPAPIVINSEAGVMRLTQSDITISDYDFPAEGAVLATSRREASVPSELAGSNV